MATTTKPRPLTPRAEEVLAIREGRQTMLWEPVKNNRTPLADVQDCPNVIVYETRGETWAHFTNEADTSHEDHVRCPYGSVGDVLYLREKWEVIAAMQDRKRPVSYSGHFIYHADAWGKGTHTAPTVVLPISKDRYEALDYIRHEESKWRPARSMPHWAARTFLEITEIKAARVQSVSEAEAIACGATVDRVASLCNVPWSSMPTLDDAFRVLFDARHGEGSWERNLLCWAVAWRRAEK